MACLAKVSVAPDPGITGLFVAALPVLDKPIMISPLIFGLARTASSFFRRASSVESMTRV